MARQRCSNYFEHACQDLSLEDEWTTTGGSRPIPCLVCDKITAAREVHIVIATETTVR